MAPWGAAPLQKPSTLDRLDPTACGGLPHDRSESAAPRQHTRTPGAGSESPGPGRGSSPSALSVKETSRLHLRGRSSPSPWEGPALETGAA